MDSVHFCTYRPEKLILYFKVDVRYIHTMRVQIVSNLWNHMPAKFVRTAPTLILAGNIGYIGSPKTIELVNTLSKGFAYVFWIPYATETFTEGSAPLCVEMMKKEVHTHTDAKMLCNDVVTFGGETIVATSGWRRAKDGAPNTQQIDWWSQEDDDFIKENATMDTVLISAGSKYYWKPKTVIIGSPPAGYENITAASDKQIIYTNSAHHKGFCPSAQFQLA